MGYLTRFQLECDNSEIDYHEVVCEEIGYDPFDDHYKWYSHQKDMKEISKLHPNTLFKLIGEGEEPNDLWQAYFKDGKIQVCKATISYDDFDEEKLT